MNATDVECPFCKAPVGAECMNTLTGGPMVAVTYHFSRERKRGESNAIKLNRGRR